MKLQNDITGYVKKKSRKRKEVKTGQLGHIQRKSKLLKNAKLEVRNMAVTPVPRVPLSVLRRIRE